MAAFVIRVELHNATSSDYDRLHEKMKAQGFGRTITGSDNVVYELPTAQYRISAELTGQQVFERASTAATATATSSAILVTQEASSTWGGLKKV